MRDGFMLTAVHEFKRLGVFAKAERARVCVQNLFRMVFLPAPGVVYRHVADAILRMPFEFHWNRKPVRAVLRLDAIPVDERPALELNRVHHDKVIDARNPVQIAGPWHESWLVNGDFHAASAVCLFPLNLH